MAQAPSFSCCASDSAEHNGWYLGQLCIRYVYHSTNINAALQVISCSQLLFLESCGCSVSLLRTAFPNLSVDNRTARCSNKERIQDEDPML